MLSTENHNPTRQISNRDTPEMMMLQIGGGVFLMAWAILLALVLLSEWFLIALVVSLGIFIFCCTIVIEFEVRPSSVEVLEEGVWLSFRVRKARVIKWNEVSEFTIKQGNPSSFFLREGYGVIIDSRHGRYNLDYQAAWSVKEALDPVERKQFQ